MRALLLAGVVAFGWVAVARANLISDPGFEATQGAFYVNGGSLGDGWFADPGVASATGFPHSGSRYLVLNYATPGTTDFGGVKQTIATAAGATYNLTFWANSDTSTNTFTVTFDGVPVAGVPSSLPNTGFSPTTGRYIQYASVVTASTSASLLDFKVSGVSNGFVRLDDVDLELAVATPVPEPGSLALLGISVAGIAATRRHRAA